MAVFVLHPDLDVLSGIVGKLRDRGLDTVHATEPRTLVERSAKTRPRLLLMPVGFDPMGLRATLGAPPELFFSEKDLVDEPSATRIVEQVTSALAAAVRADVPVTSSGEVRGDLAQLPLADLLQMLSLGRKTGTLTVTTSSGAGELRLADGDVVDASFRRAEGMKAVVRLLGERDGAFHFAPDAGPALRRIREPISTILMEGTRQADEVVRLRERLGLPPPATHLALSATVAASSLAQDALATEVVSLLAQPRVLDDLLDDAPRNDLDVLMALTRLDAAGALKRIPIGELRPSLAGPEGMVVLRGLAQRLRPRGYRNNARIVFAGDRPTVRLSRAALQRLVEATPGADLGSELAGDRCVEATVTLYLGESTGLEIYTLIDEASYAPTWPMVLAGALAVVAMQRPSQALLTMAEELEVALVDPQSLTDWPLDPSEPSSLATVVRSAIEAMGSA